MTDRALILTDGKAGHENQSRAFARALGCEPDVVEVHFKSKVAKAASYFLDRFGIGCAGLLKDFPDVTAARGKDYRAVLGTGSGTFYAAKTLARKLGIPCGVVLYPRGYDLKTFDCILAPAFDRPAPAANVVEIPANLVANDAAFYEKGVAAFRERHPSAESCEAEAVIIGGPNKCSTMSVAWMKARLDALFASAPGPAPERWVTTSRRTPPDVEALVDSYPWDYKLIYSRDHFNPIPAFVKLARRLYVTAESTGMLSEACTFGAAEVVAWDNLQPGPHKFRRFVEGLVAGGYAGFDAAAHHNRKVDLSEQFARAKSLLS